MKVRKYKGFEIFKIGDVWHTNPPVGNNYFTTLNDAKRKINRLYF